jgi:hypothetical protein
MTLGGSDHALPVHVAPILATSLHEEQGAMNTLRFNELIIITATFKSWSAVGDIVLPQVPPTPSRMPPA